jgi:hypothetical protein
MCYVNNCIENEKHVLLECPVYADLRCYLFEHACFYYNNFMQLSDDEKFVFLFSDENLPVSIFNGATPHLSFANELLYFLGIFTEK